MIYREYKIFTKAEELDALVDALNAASGIIDDKEGFTVNAIKNAGFDVLEILRDDCWVAVAAQLKE